MKTLMNMSIGLLFMFPYACYAGSNQSTEEQSDDARSFASMYVERVLTTLRQKAPDRLKLEIKQISYKIIDSNDPMILRATPGQESAVLEISTGAVDLLCNLAFAEAAAVFVEDGPQKWAKWTQLVGERIREGKFDYPDFLKFTGDEPPPQNEVSSSLLRNHLIASMSYALAHECSHAVLGHLEELRSRPSRERMRSLEHEADDLAVDLLVAVAGNKAQDYMFYGTGYMELFMFGMQLNRDILGHESLRDHPPEPERAMRMARKFKKIAGSVFENREERQMVERVFDARIREYETYRLILEYQKYLYTPGSEDLSLEEWQQKYRK